MTENISFKEALNFLAKSSPHSVVALDIKDPDLGLDSAKKELFHVIRPIEKEFCRILEELAYQPDRILFVCGSSGDGKSKLIKWYTHDFIDDIDIHSDATHAFSAKDDAVVTLDKVFKDNKNSDKPLIVGINMGMIDNYASDGSVTDVKRSFELYLADKTVDIPSNHIFLNFEDYPDYQIINEKDYIAPFTKDLLNNIVTLSRDPETGQENFIKKAYLQDTDNSAEVRRYKANFKLLAIPEVQNVVVELLFKVRLFNAQFITARTLRDFIYHLITGPALISDNLFCSTANELAAKIKDFDPVNTRTKYIDDFTLKKNIGLQLPEFEQFNEQLKAYCFDLELLSSPAQYLRLFYLLKNTAFLNDYHKSFEHEFEDQLLNSYISTWYGHSQYQDVYKDKLTTFYEDVLFVAIRKYNHRTAQELEEEQILLSKYSNDFIVAAELDFEIDFEKIECEPVKKLHYFTAYILVDETPLSIAININLLLLLQNIVNGYRPNKHDITTVMLLVDLIEQIINVGSQSKKLIVKGQDKSFKLSRSGSRIKVRK